jgi:hypothetical protein
VNGCAGHRAGTTWGKHVKTVTSWATLIASLLAVAVAVSVLPACGSKGREGDDRLILPPS